MFGGFFGLVTHFCYAVWKGRQHFTAISVRRTAIWWVGFAVLCAVLLGLMKLAGNWWLAAA
jgi:hypothetical protein